MHLGKVLVTGANRGLGKHIQRNFHDHGYDVLIHNGSSDYNFIDIKDIMALGNKAKEERVNILINNAAITCPGKNLKGYTPQEIQEMIAVNLIAPILLTNILLENLTDVININSMVCLEVNKNRTIYSATKWGLRGFAQSLKAEQQVINVLDVYPTNIKTTPEKLNAMEVDVVVEKIYDSFLRKENKLVLDGRIR